MGRTLKNLHKKWYAFAGLVLAGLIYYFLCPGYQFSGLFYLGLSLLIPLYHFLGNIPGAKLRRGLIRMLSLFLAAFAAAAAITCGVIVSSARGSEEPEADYLIVLGAGVNGTVPSRSLQERIDAAYAYLSDYPDAIAVVSGGQGDGEEITEAACMYRELVKLGISPDRIWLEEEATTTLENLRFSLDLIEANTGTRPTEAAIVSSEYHLHRSGIFARWLDLEPKLVPTKTRAIPLRVNYYLREVFAVWYYSVFGG